jgi:hypothetical protein
MTSRLRLGAKQRRALGVQQGTAREEGSTRPAPTQPTEIVSADAPGTPGMSGSLSQSCGREGGV